MKIIKEYSHRNMKRIEYDGNDINLLKSRFSFRVKEETIEKLCYWLLRNNETIDVDDCYDGQSGWQGTHIYIKGEDLSLNGYCLSDNTIENFLNKQQ
jgi:hypothetical protein